ncbi:hypothetical protein [Peribacillus huizhouensis]|uniref:Uncharacterized protein n=1 Tax=Peribacillus huizhouensis TaxID=1501239 RepID=A0ABR6CIA1_9BACI|nr:hypothetical protein [Peribacillus huizhouensis]MBA9024723.1 hypothetical protein [Peribacillus huizhouensis]
MQEINQHILNVIDFMNTDHKTLFVKVMGYDANLGKEFSGEIKFLNGMPFGDLIHPKRSILSPDCIRYIRENLLSKYNAGKFT